MYVACEDSEEELVRRIHRRSGKTAVPKGTVRLVSRLGEDNVLCAASKLGGTLKATQFYDELKKKAREFFGTDGGVLVLDTLADIYAYCIFQYIIDRLYRVCGNLIGRHYICYAHGVG